MECTIPLTHTKTLSRKAGSHVTLANFTFAKLCSPGVALRRTVSTVSSLGRSGADGDASLITKVYPRTFLCGPSHQDGFTSLGRMCTCAAFAWSVATVPPTPRSKNAGDTASARASSPSDAPCVEETDLGNGPCKATGLPSSLLTCAASMGTRVSSSSGNVSSSHAAAAAFSAAKCLSVTRGYFAPRGTTGHMACKSPVLARKYTVKAPQPFAGANAKSTTSGRNGEASGNDPFKSNFQHRSTTGLPPAATLSQLIKRKTPSVVNIASVASALGCHAHRTTRTFGTASNSSSHTPIAAHARVSTPSSSSFA
mmetsp:Transcript_910/g.3795  ORF Transcript_910/g.3795 Transcript_910/m.3795 type:complete len:311 (-) Transcript_910:1219-2151(-)